MANIVENAIDLIGNTPLLKLENIKKKFNLKGNIYAKVEYFNPAGSVKDRVAKEMIEDAERKGLINKDSVIIEPTSGNTGIGLSLVCAVKGYRLVIVMPETMSVERRTLMKAYGAELVLTDGKSGMAGAIEKAQQLALSTKNSFIPGQFTNRANADAHFKTTGPEIFDALDGKVDYFVAGVGTGGTITGVGEFLKSKNKNVKIVAVEPSTSAVLSGESKGKHDIQGIGAGFIPQVLNTKIYDEIVKITDEESYETSKMLTKTEGIFCGISSGASLLASIRIAQKCENEGKNIVVLLPDTGARYLSTKMFEEK